MRPMIRVLALDWSLLQSYERGLFGGHSRPNSALPQKRNRLDTIVVPLVFTLSSATFDSSHAFAA